MIVAPSLLRNSRIAPSLRHATLDPAVLPLPDLPPPDTPVPSPKQLIYIHHVDPLKYLNREQLWHLSRPASLPQRLSLSPALLPVPHAPLPDNRNNLQRLHRAARPRVPCRAADRTVGPHAAVNTAAPLSRQPAEHARAQAGAPAASHGRAHGQRHLVRGVRRHPGLEVRRRRGGVAEIQSRQVHPRD